MTNIGLNIGLYGVAINKWLLRKQTKNEQREYAYVSKNACGGDPSSIVVEQVIQTIILDQIHLTLVVWWWRRGGFSFFY